MVRVQSCLFSALELSEKHRRNNPPRVCRRVRRQKFDRGRGPGGRRRPMMGERAIQRSARHWRHRSAIPAPQSRPFCCNSPAAAAAKAFGSPASSRSPRRVRAPSAAPSTCSTWRLARHPDFARPRTGLDGVQSRSRGAARWPAPPVQRAIEQGADLVVLSKFGKLEAGHGGLCDAFAAAMAAETPVRTTLKPLMRTEWADSADSPFR